MKFLCLIDSNSGRSIWLNSLGDYLPYGDVIATLSQAHEDDIPVREVVNDDLDTEGKKAFEILWKDCGSINEFAKAFNLLWDSAYEIY